MSIHTPSIDDLKLFITLIRHKSLSDCANNLGVSTANISKRLAQLEQKMGLKLMHRTTRKISLTEVGETFAEWGQRVLDCSQEMMEAVSAEKTIPRGTLRVCSSSGFGRARVAPALSELLRTYPDLEIQLELLDRPVDLITEGFHLDIRVGAVEEPDMICRKILSNHRILCASADYLERKPPPKMLHDLQHHNCLVIRERDQQHGRWTLQGPLGEETIRVKGALSSNNGEAVRQWILDGHGVGLRSVWDISPALQQKHILQILPEYYQEANVCAVYPSRLASSARLRVCVEFLVEWLKQKNCA